MKLIEIFKEIYRYRALIFALVSRHLAQRYRGSALGFLWSILNPLCLMGIYALVFQYYIRFDQVENYTIFLFCGLLPWIWMQSAVIEAGNSIIASGHLITKSVFPAQILPIVSVLANLVNFTLSLPVLFVFMWAAGITIGWQLLALPLLMLLTFFFLTGLGFLVSSLNVYYRDVQHIISNALTFLFFLSPIIYPRSVVPEQFQITLDLNPFALFTEMYRDLILNATWPPLISLAAVFVWTFAVLLLGCSIFVYNREYFAEAL